VHYWTRIIGKELINWLDLLIVTTYTYQNSTRLWFYHRYAIFSGIERQFKEIEAKCYRQVQVQVQVLDIVYQMDCFAANPRYILTKHSHFESEDVLMKPNIIYYQVMNDGVYFIQLDKDYNPYDTTKNSFMQHSLTSKARRVYRMPTANFIRFGCDLQDKPITWLFHSTRCGSTLWAQIFNNVPNWVTLSEPPLLNYMFILNARRIYIPEFVETDFYYKLVEAVVKTSVKHFNGKDGIFWKTTLMDDPIVPVLRKVFPKHKLILATRNVSPSAQSFARAFGPGFYRSTVILSWNPVFNWGSASEMLLYFTNGMLTPRIQSILCDVKPQNLLEWTVVFWSIKLRMLQREAAMFHVRYEDLVSDSQGTLTRIFNHLSIPVKHIEVAAEALQRDSQQASLFGKEIRSKHTPWKRTEKSVARCNRILESFGLPGFDEEYVYKCRDWNCKDF